MPSLKRPQDAAGGLEARRAVTPCHAPTTLHTRPLGASEAPQQPPPYNRASLNNAAREGRSRRRARPWPLAPPRRGWTGDNRPTTCAAAVRALPAAHPSPTKRGPCFAQLAGPQRGPCELDQNSRLVRLGAAAPPARPGGWSGAPRLGASVGVRACRPRAGHSAPRTGASRGPARLRARTPALAPASGRMTRPTLGARPEHRPRTNPRLMPHAQRVDSGREGQPAIIPHIPGRARPIACHGSVIS